MTRAPVQDVVRVLELEGPKGGTQLVHLLACGDWVCVRRKAPAKRMPCVACWLRDQGVMVPAAD